MCRPSGAPIGKPQVLRRSQFGNERKREPVVRDTGIEPVTSSVSGKRSPAELIAPDHSLRWRRESNPCARLCRPLPHHSATPPLGLMPLHLRADDGIRTRDPHLGKVMRYQLRYIRAPRTTSSPVAKHDDSPPKCSCTNLRVCRCVSARLQSKTPGSAPKRGGIRGPSRPRGARRNSGLRTPLGPRADSGRDPSPC